MVIRPNSLLNPNVVAPAARTGGRRVASGRSPRSVTAVDERYVSGGIHGEPSAANVAGIADLPPTGMTMLARVFMPDGSKTDLVIPAG